MPINLGYPYPNFSSQPSTFTPIGDNAATEEGFQPNLNEKNLRDLISLYKKNPTLVPPEQVDNMQKHAVLYNVPFHKGDFSIMGALSEFGKGFLSGFTTMDIGDPPDNEYEAIVRNIGHLAGFAPGIAAGPLKALRVPVLAKAAMALNNRSVPMMGANWLTKKAKKIVKPALETAIKGKGDATKTVSKFLLGSQAKHMAEGAFHLGAASAISSWTQGVDAMIHSAFGGAVAGGAFRAMGNFVNTGSKDADKIVRGLAGSLFMGLPATARGATSAEQVYEYLLGAYFGGKEMPWYKAKGFKTMASLEKQAQKNPELAITRDPRLLKEWESLEPEVQKEVIKEAEKLYGNADERGAAAHLLMKEMGILDKNTKLPTPKGFTELKKVIGGQELVRLTDPSQVLHHGISGAAKGSDAYWAIVGKNYQVPFVHYAFKGQKTSRGAGKIRELNEAELAEANIKIKKADESLNRLKGKKAKGFTQKLLQRNWWQVKTSRGIYALGKIIKGGTELQGGSGWATQMAIDARKKHVYAWDTTSKKWHRYDYKLKKFRMLDRTPKLVKRFAGIGTRKLTNEGRKAIEDIYAVTFGKKKPLVTRKAEAVPEKDISIIPAERLKRINELSEQELILDKELDIHMQDSKNTDLSNSQRISAKKEAQKVAAQLNEIRKELKDETYSTVKEEDLESPETQDGNDIGMMSGRDLEKKSVYFIDKYAKKLWDDTGYTPVMKLTKKAQFASILQDIINKPKYSTKGSKVKVEEIINEFESIIKKQGEDISIRAEGKRNLRQWLTLKSFGKQVRYLRADDRGIYIAPLDRVITRAGNKKLVNEPTKRLEEVFLELGGKETDKEPPIIIFDTITSGKNGAYKDLSLSRYRQMEERDDFTGTPYYTYIKKVFKKMLGKGYYPFGGRGDADAITFVKMNPMLTNKSEMRLFKRAVEKSLGQKGIKQIKDGMALFKKTYGLSDKVQDMYYSNLLYDIQMNGFRPDLEIGTRLEKAKIWNDTVSKFFRDNKTFIPNATALNKRNQIWFTPGWKADPEFVKDFMKTRSGKKGFINDLKEDSFKYIIVKDIDKELGRKLKLTDKNSDDPTSVDGMIIVRDDVIDAVNADAGQPSSGQNKSFIVSPDSKHGALLGKYMMHSAGPEATRAMQKKGLHFIMQESAVKQAGDRAIGSYSYDGKSLKYSSSEYLLPIEHIKYNYSVKQDAHMLQPKRIPKQLFMAMGKNAFSEFSNDLINDFFTETVYKRFRGEDAYNNMLDNYINNPQKERLNELLDNIDKVGIDNLLHAIKHGHNDFTDLAYAKLMKFNREALREMVASGEMSAERMQEVDNNLVEFNTATDRLIKETNIWSGQEKASGRDGDITPIVLHKYVRPFRVQVIRNYIMENLAKPKIKNSAIARMRGYDKFFQSKKEFKDLETRDDIFFLDESYKHLKLDTHLGEEFNTLGKLWEAYVSKGKKWVHRADAEEILRAATVRVPMDSTSGAQVLKFGGFTGRKGHGILMHGRAMKAEGGADLDGDEAFIFFGGRKGGKGDGFKKSWKDAFEANKEEFYEGEYTYDNKNEKIRKELTKQDSKTTTGIDPKTRDSAAWKYMPGWRVMISERARDGRNQLGSASNNVQLLKAFHNSLLEKGQDRYFIGKGKDKKEIIVTPKKDITKARKLASSMIAFASDPLDEAGLKNYKSWFVKLYNSYFNVTKDGKKTRLIEKDFNSLSYNGMYNQLRKMNQGMFSRNWSADRNFNMHEINMMTASVTDKTTFGKSAIRNTMLPKLASIANKIDYSDSVYRRAHLESLENMYKEHTELVKKYPDLVKFLGRSSIEVPLNNYVKNTKEFYLYNDNAIDIVSKSYKTFVKALKGTHFSHKLKAGELKDNNWKNIQKRKHILEKLRDLSEDFLVNDITDMVTVKLLAKDAGKISKNDFKEIHRFTDKLKKQSYLMAKNRRNFMDSFNRLDKMDPEHRKFFREMYDTHEKLYGKEETKKVFPKGRKVFETPVEDISALKDQLEIDAELKTFKEKLSPEGKRLTDVLMLGSLRRGKLSEINKLDKEWGKKLRKDPLYEDLLHSLKMKGSKTSVSKLGLSSQEVDGKVLREFFGEFSKVMRKSWDKPTELDAEVKDADKVKEGTVYEEFIDKKVEGTEVDEIYSGFEGLESADLSVLTPEKRQVITELAENLKFYNNKMGKDLNALTRGMFEKDLNAMNLADFADMNAYFKELRGGTIWQKLFNETTPDMRKRYWWQFPATVGREMMKYEIMFLKSKGIFTTQKGLVPEKGGIIMKPTNVISAAQKILGRMSEQGVQEGERLVGNLRKKLGFLEGIEDGEALRRLAVSKAETAEIERIFNSEHIPNELKGIQADEYRLKYKEELKKSDYINKKDKKYIVTNTEGERESLKGSDIVKRVEEVYDAHFKEMYKTIEGESGVLDKYTLGYYDKIKEKPIIDHKAFIRDVLKDFNAGKGISLKYGLTPLRHISRSMMIEQAKILGNQKLLTKLLKFEIPPVGRIRKGYYPHLFFSKSKAMDALKRAHDYIKNLPENVMSKEDKIVQIQKLLTKHKTLTGDWMEGIENWDAFDKAVQNIKEKKSTDPISAFDNANQMTGSMNTRMAHVGGWSIDAAAAESYTRNQINTYYKQFSQIMSRDLLNKFTKKAMSKPHEWHKIKDYGDNTSLLTRWQNWLKLYISESMGSPSIIPDFILNDPKMKVKGTPYAWWADNKVKEKANKIAKKLGLRGKNLLIVKEDLERIDYNDLRHWSNLEAKFELMSLLAHPKSAVANIFGGSLHTIQSTGLEYLRKARSISDLQKINPNWESLTDVDKFVVKHGVLPEFIIAELGLSREAQSANVKAFIKDLSAKITKTGEVDKETLRDINRKHKVSESIMNKAAKFMSVPERALRRDAFMAHYIKAWERFGGAIKNPDHPFLIEMAKKGVKATQFLYSAPYRPAFARTALGKVMTRFQLWSWNAVRFRNDVLREAKVRGFRRGTAEFERFKRTMQTDLFVLALANAFAYSLFDSALPAPYNWLKDTSEWIFGDEKERDKAFFGTWPSIVAPLQIITPPIMRLPVAGLRAFLDNDYEKLAHYHIYTMLPFGRMVRDVSPLAKGNLIENPSRILEKSMGFPLGDLQGMAKKIKEGDAYHPKKF